MRSTFAGLNTMVRGIFAHQIALDTVGNNITNLNTDGYSRQRVNIVETPPEYITGSKGQLAIGTGVSVASIERLRDEMIDNQVRRGNSPLGHDDVMKDILGRIEEVFKEPSDTGLQSSMDNFWNAWQQLAVNAADNGSRSVVRQRGIELVDAIKRAETGLNDIATDANFSLTAKVKSLNQNLTDLAAVNKQILASPSDQANGLKDQQDLLLEKISYLAKIQTVKETSGSVTVAIGGINVVDRDRVSLFNTVVDSDGTIVGANGNLTIAGTGMEVKIGTDGGEIQGLLDARDSTTWGVPAFLDKLGTMSEFLLTDFNAVHRDGYGLDNANNVNFFGDVSYGTGASKIGTTLRQVSTEELGSTPFTVPPGTQLTFNDGTNNMIVTLQPTWDINQVAEAINAQANSSGVNVRANYNADTKKFELFTTGDSRTLTATANAAGGSFLINTLKLDKPTAAYWLDTLEVNSDILALDGLQHIAAKSEHGRVGSTETEVKSSSIWRGNTGGGAMTATVTGFYTFDPESMPIRVRIKELNTTAADGTNSPKTLEYSTDGSTWTAATAGSTANTFQFTAQGATVKMSIADNAANTVNDMYVITLPAGNEGNAGGDNAVLLAELLKVKPSTTLGKASLDGYYNNFIGGLGVQSQNAQNQSTNNNALVSQAKTMRDAISGVNLDEELTNMIKYQKGYNGCARMLTAMDEILDKLINGTGMVGR